MLRAYRTKLGVHDNDVQYSPAIPSAAREKSGVNAVPLGCGHRENLLTRNRVVGYQETFLPLPTKLPRQP